MTKMYIDYAVIKQALKALENDILRNAANRGRQIAAATSRIGQLEAQRDALLQALKAAEPYLRHADVDYNVYVQCRAAIKAVEEGK